MPAGDSPLGVDVGLSLIRNVLQHVDQGIDDAELLQAFNFGVGKIVRAVLSVRPSAYVTWVEPFVISPNVTEYDIGVLEPPCYRPLRLLSTGNNGQNPAVRFQYKPLHAADFEQQEVARPGNFALFFYDVLDGMFPGTDVGGVPGDSRSEVVVASASQFAPGSLLRIPGAGPDVPVPGVSGATYPGPYYGTVLSLLGTTLTVSPPLAVQPAAFSVTPLRQRVLKLANSPVQSVSGRLYYDYRPERLTAADRLDPLTARYVDAIVNYAVASLKLARGESDSRMYFEWAQEGRSEAMQDLEPAGQTSDHLGSDLEGMGDT